MNETTIVHCPICNTAVTWDQTSLYRPFCSSRCKLTDLGEWAAQERRIASWPQNPEDQ